MRTPSFWSDDGNILSSMASTLLSPLGALYATAVHARFALTPPATADIPVVCIGNFVVGGAGKTPTAITIANLLRQAGRQPAFLSRGYGGTEFGPALVDKNNATAERFGDEPLLLADTAPTIVSRRRPPGAKLAAHHGADIVIMDDGLQNPTLKKSVSIAVVDSKVGIGNGRIFPAGPLRANLTFQLRLIDAVVIVGPDNGAEDITAMAKARGIPVFNAQIRPAPGVMDIAGKSVIAFAGIGRPEKFFQTLEQAGAKLAAQCAFADHHRFSVRDAENLLRQAAASGAQLITTEKDMARLSGEDGLEALRNATKAYSITLEIAGADKLINLIGNKCGF